MRSVIEANFDYSRIPDKFRLGSSPLDTVTLFKGGLRARRGGFLSDAALNNRLDEIARAISIVESGDEEAINRMIDLHTDPQPNSPFLSTSFNPEAAQVFAPTKHHRTHTIYQLRISVSRCILDALDIGKAGLSGEILVLGKIDPSEVVAFKLDNTPPESELAFRYPTGLRVTLERPDPNSVTRQVKNPANWVQL